MSAFANLRRLNNHKHHIVAATMLVVTNALDAYVSAVVFGAGIGGLFTLFPLAWAATETL